MRVVEVIESKRWKNISSGATASIYGAVPYWNKEEEKNWKIETIGYTWRCNDGTIGLGRQCVATYEEAVEVMDRVNNLYKR